MKSDISKVTRITESVGFPDVILIDNFSGCNFRCSICDHKNIKNYRKIQRMDFGLYTKIIDEIAIEKPEARVWNIFFGEPFLCIDMPERIKYAKQKGLKDVVLNTNGMLMDEKKAKAVIEAGLDAIYVGIDAMYTKTYDKIRIGGNLTMVSHNVIGYRGLLNQIGKPNQKIYVQFVVNEFNENEVEEFKQYWAFEGIPVKIRPKVSWGGLINADNLVDNDNNRKPCYWIMRTINICADGKVALCSADVHCRVECGDANVMSIKDLWNDKLTQYRELHKKGRFDKLPQMCYECKDWQSTYSEIIE